VAERTIAGQLWPEGTVVSAYPAAAWVDKTRAPTGAAVTSPGVVSGGSVTFGGLSENTRYVAYGDGHGVSFMASRDLQAPPAQSRTDRERLAVLESASVSVPDGGGVSYAATDAALPETATGHPIVLVLEDSAAPDAQGHGRATLRYWTGTEWEVIGLASAGTGGVETFTVSLSVLFTGGAVDQPLTYDADHARFQPGALVPE
jgi:hypothetical protein